MFLQVTRNSGGLLCLVHNSKRKIVGPLPFVLSELKFLWLLCSYNLCGIFSWIMQEVVLERLAGIKREYEELDTVWFMAGSLFKVFWSLTSHCDMKVEMHVPFSWDFAQEMMGKEICFWFYWLRLLDSVQQYPFDLPTEAFPFEIFKQAFVAVQSCVVHLQVLLA